MFYTPLKHSSGHKEWLRCSPGTSTESRFGSERQCKQSTFTSVCYKHTLSTESFTEAAACSLSFTREKPHPGRKRRRLRSAQTQQAEIWQNQALLSPNRVLLGWAPSHTMTPLT